MKSILLALVLLLLAGCAGQPRADVSGQALVASATAHEIVFKDGGICSATAIGHHTLLTAQHCLTSPLASVDGKPVRVLWTALDGKDHALLGVDTDFAAVIDGFCKPVRGLVVVMVGNPGGNHLLLRSGRVAGTHGGATLYDVRIFFGDSGSGLIAADGRLVGVVSQVYVMSDRGAVLTFAVSFPLAFTARQLAIVQ